MVDHVPKFQNVGDESLFLALPGILLCALDRFPLPKLFHPAPAMALIGALVSRQIILHNFQYVAQFPSWMR